MANEKANPSTMPTTSNTGTGTRKRARTTSTNEFMIVPDIVTIGSSSSSSSSAESDVSFDCQSITTSPRSSDISITSLEGDDYLQQKFRAEKNLNETLGTSLISLINSPWSGPFRDAVNPERSHFPDHFFEITDHPIDLYTIMEKLSDGCYENNAWEYIDDVCLIFRNTWLFYKDEPQSHVYQYCTNLAKDFEKDIEPVMQRLGHFCSDHKHTISPQTLL